MFYKEAQSMPIMCPTTSITLRLGYMGMGGAQIHIHLPLCHIVMEYSISTCRGKQVCKEVEIKSIMYHAT